MPGIKGQIGRAPGGEHRPVYLSDVFSVWSEGNHLHVTMIKGGQQLHTSVARDDGLLYDVLQMLYHHGLAMNP